MSELTNMLFNISKKNPEFERLFYHVNLASVAYPNYENVNHDSGSKILNLAHALDLLEELEPRLNSADATYIYGAILDLIEANKKRFRPFYWFSSDTRDFSSDIKELINYSLKLATMLLINNKYSVLKEHLVKEYYNKVEGSVLNTNLGRELRVLVIELMDNHSDTFFRNKKSYIPHKIIENMLPKSFGTMYSKSESILIRNEYIEYLTRHNQDSKDYRTDIISKYESKVTDMHKGKSPHVEFVEACYSMSFLEHNYINWLIMNLTGSDKPVMDLYELYMEHEGSPVAEAILTYGGNLKLLERMSSSNTVPYVDLIDLILTVDLDRINSGHVNGFKYSRALMEMKNKYNEYQVKRDTSLLGEAIKERYELIRASDNSIAKLFMGRKAIDVIQNERKDSVDTDIIGIYLAVNKSYEILSRKDYLEINRYLDKIERIINTSRLNRSEYIILVGCHRVLSEAKER